MSRDCFAAKNAARNDRRGSNNQKSSIVNRKSKMIRRSRFTKILIILLAAALFRAAPVLAHAVFVSANPGPNQIVAQSPQELVIRFSEPVAPQFSSIVLFTQSGQQVDVGDIRVANANRTALAVDLPPLSNGTFLVSWQVLSTVDSHSTSARPIKLRPRAPAVKMVGNWALAVTAPGAADNSLTPTAKGKLPL
ncbi:MAG: copper resistance protein CopC, partial [Chloroflexi bacterium]